MTLETQQPLHGEGFTGQRDSYSPVSVAVASPTAEHNTVAPRYPLSDFESRKSSRFLSKNEIEPENESSAENHPVKRASKSAEICKRKSKNKKSGSQSPEGNSN